MYSRNSPLDHDEDNPLPKCGEGRPVRNLNLPPKRALMPPRLERARALDAKLAEIWDLGGRDAGRKREGRVEACLAWPPLLHPLRINLQYQPRPERRG